MTTDLQNRFNSAFHKIMSHTPSPLQREWDGVIEWHENKLYPTIAPSIIQALPPAARAAYVSLLNKLSRGMI